MREFFFSSEISCFFFHIFFLIKYFFFSLYSPKYVHLINQQFYDEGKESAYDLSTTASSSSVINPIHNPSTALSRLMQDDNIPKNHISDDQGRLNGLPNSLKKTHKHSQLPHSFSNSSNLVTVMMDDKNHDSDENSFYMPLRRDENGHNTEYDEGIKSLRGAHLLTLKLCYKFCSMLIFSLFTL